MTTMPLAPGADAVHEMVPLTQLRSGQKGRIAEVFGGGDLAHRLREMGLRAGAMVEVVRAGSPCIIRLETRKLCVRADEVMSVLVRPGVAAAC